jgi:hypothetical protein
MTGQLASHGGDGGVYRCTICGGTAAGPCARCRNPTCGDCCVLTDGSAGKWAICLRCERSEGKSMGRAWRSLALWLLMPIVALVLLLVLLQMLFG